MLVANPSCQGLESIEWKATIREDTRAKETWRHLGAEKELLKASSTEIAIERSVHFSFLCPYSILANKAARFRREVWDKLPNCVQMQMFNQIDISQRCAKSEEFSDLGHTFRWKELELVSPFLGRLDFLHAVLVKEVTSRLV